MELINNYQVPEGYKKTEVGVIPEDWEVDNLGKFITEFRGGAPLKPSDFTKGGVKVLPKGAVVRGGFLKINDKDLQFCSKQYANHYGKNKINNSYIVVVLRDLVPSGPSIGLIVKIKEPEIYILAQGVYGFKTQGIIDEYLIQYSNSFPYRRLMNEIMVGSTQVHITNTAFKAIKLPFPPLPEQKAIAQTLSDVDALIAALDKLIAKKRNIKTATMQQLLAGKTRLPGFAEGKGYKKSAIGLIPEDWKIEELGSIGKFKNGINKSSEDFGHGSPFVNLMDVFGVCSISEVEHLGLVHSNDAEKNVYNLKEGDVIFIRSSVKPSGVGLTTVITRDLPDTVYSGFLIRFRDNDTLETDFKTYCFAEEKFRRNVIANSTVSANTNINQDSLKKLVIAYPKSPEEQKAIAKVLSDMDKEITALEKRRAKTQAVKQGMMQELLTGKTRLKIEPPDEPITPDNNN